MFKIESTLEDFLSLIEKYNPTEISCDYITKQFYFGMYDNNLYDHIFVFTNYTININGCFQDNKQKIIDNVKLNIRYNKINKIKIEISRKYIL